MTKTIECKGGKLNEYKGLVSLSNVHYLTQIDTPFFFFLLIKVHFLHIHFNYFVETVNMLLFDEICTNSSK